MKDEIIFGKNAVISILESDRSINRILLSKGMKFDNKVKKILNLSKANKIPFQEVPKEKINSYTEESHQGVIALVSPIEYTDFEELIAKLRNKENNSLIVILDGVKDPHNLGAIIRSAKCAGADGIIIPKRRTSPVTSTVEKSSAGAVSKIPIVQVSNLNNVISILKENNFWLVGAESSGDKNYFEIDYDMNCAIVLGGENEGISKLVAKNCDMLAKIPMPGGFNSLNVSNAASIMLFEVVRQNHFAKIKKNH